MCYPVKFVPLSKHDENKGENMFIMTKNNAVLENTSYYNANIEI